MLTIIKNIKVVGIVLGISLLVILGLVFKSTYDRNRDLRVELSRQNLEIEILEDRLDSQEQSVDMYVKRLETSHKKHEELRKSFDSVSEELQECLEMEVPHDVLDKIFSY